MVSQFDIYLDDLKPDVQRRYLAELGLDSAKNANLDVFSLTTLSLDSDTPEYMTFKLYSPLKGTLYDEDAQDFGDELDGYELAQYATEIKAALRQEVVAMQTPLGLMEYYREPNSVNDKVITACTEAEVYNDRLWGVTVCETKEPLTPKELGTLCDYLTGQYSDGFGEHFEQQCISVADGGLYVHLWNDSPSYCFLKESELKREQPVKAKAPKKKKEMER